MSAVPELNIITSSPIIKAPGGKTRLLKEILPRTPQEFGCYWEPFFGGGAVFFALSSLGRITTAHINDTNPFLYRMYEDVKLTPEAVIDILRFQTNDEKHYYQIRDELNKMIEHPINQTPGILGAYFIFLNKTTYNGLIRVNRKGKFNASYGKYKNPKFCDQEAILNASIALQNASITNMDFADLLAKTKAGDFVFADPPYVPRNASEDFVEYNAEGFSLERHKELADLIKTLTTRGVRCMFCNSDMPIIRELYRDYHIEQVWAPRLINTKGEKRGKVPEVLITNY